jgi:hypothetical protein
MNRLFRALLYSLLLLGGSLACETLAGRESTTVPTAVATPTLAPTATIDPDVTPFDSSINQPSPSVSDAAISLTATTDASIMVPATVTLPIIPTAIPSNAGGSGDSSDSPDSPIVASSCPAGGQNLLANASFEGEYKPYGAFPELNHAPNWFPWWKDGENNLRPEFKPAEVAFAPNRVHGGNKAQQYFKSFGQFKAGMYQSVLNVPVGSLLQFSVHGQAWSCEESNKCPNGQSFNAADMLMRVGIDPEGGTDPFSDTIVWSEYFNPIDQWQIACSEAQANSDIVTVFVWASPNGPRQNQDVYWDDASLVLLP